MESEEKKDRNAEALRSGLILGLFSIVMTVLIYIISATLLGDWKTGLGIAAISIFLVAYFGRKYRNEENDGFMSFKESFLYSYVVLFVSSIVSAAFLILLYEVIDPELPKILSDQAIENTEKMMRNFGAPEEAIEEALEKVENEMPANFSAIGIMKNSWVYFITSAVFALIASLFIKKSKPEFE